MFIGVGEQLLAKAGVGFFSFFRKGGSFDAVALERISLYVCISAFSLRGSTVLMHMLVCMCVC